MNKRNAGWARIGVLVSAVVVSWGCASLPPVPDKGEPGWLRLESRHFVLYTDLAETDARETVRMFEQLLDGYYKLGWSAQGSLPVKLDVVLFADRSHFEVFAGDFIGYHARLVPFEPFVVMPNEGQELERFTTLKHELTHYIALQSIPSQPLWFAEGLAGYFQTAYFDDEQRFVIGEVPRDLIAVLRSLGRIRAAQLFAKDAPEPAAQVYATSWLLVHYLLSERGDAFVRYQNGLVEGLTHEAAWLAAFPDLPVERVDEELARYFSVGAYAKYMREVAADAGPEPRTSKLNRADVYALRAQLYRTCPVCGADERRIADQNVADALRLEPDHLRASVLRIATTSKKERVRMADALVRAHPDAPLAWIARGFAELSSSAPSRCTPETATRLRDLGATSAHAQMLAATCRAYAGASEEARALAERALRRQPADSALLLLHAEVLRTVGDCAELKRVVTRLQHAMHPRLPQEAIAPYQRCGS